MGKQGRQKFTDIWANQTDLGKQFGLSAIAMGKKRKRAGLARRGRKSNHPGAWQWVLHTNAAQGWHAVLYVE